MPADRIITLSIRAEGERNVHGEYIPGAVIASPTLWATVVDSGSSDVETVGGVDVVQRKDFTVRWRRDALVAGPQRVAIVDEYGHTFDVETIDENTNPANRRRFITLQAVAVL